MATNLEKLLFTGDTEFSCPWEMEDEQGRIDPEYVSDHLLYHSGDRVEGSDLRVWSYNNIRTLEFKTGESDTPVYFRFGMTDRSGEKYTQFVDKLLDGESVEQALDSIYASKKDGQALRGFQEIEQEVEGFPDQYMDDLERVKDVWYQ